jgi:predicted nucleotidyltransferase
VKGECAVPVAPADDPVLIRFRAALDALYGERIERVVLFGSRARGDAREDSDYDVAVFLKDLTDRWAELDRLADLSTDIVDQTGAVVHALPYRAGAYQDRTSLMREIRIEGVDL